MIDPKYLKFLEENKYFCNQDKESLIEKALEGSEKPFCDCLDEDTQAIKDYAHNQREKFNKFVVCGLGGSALGTASVYEAFAKYKDHPKLQILDNIDPDFLNQELKDIDFEKTLFLFVSKSGQTIETISQYTWIKQMLEKQKREISVHGVCITDEGSSLNYLSQKLNIPCFLIPQALGGRWSIQSNVGLLPMALLGLDIDEFLDGCKSMRDSFLNKKFDQNLSFQLASFLFSMYKQGKTNQVFMPYISSLSRWTDWVVQLVAESTGKFNKNNESVGITPIPALGVTDQHAQAQLFLEGPKDKALIFIQKLLAADDITIPPLDPCFDLPAPRSFLNLLHTELRSFEKSLDDKEVPHMRVVLETLDLRTFGSLCMLFEGAVFFLGSLMEINVFDQPGVKAIKDYTEEQLKN